MIPALRHPAGVITKGERAPRTLKAERQLTTVARQVLGSGLLALSPRGWFKDDSTSSSVAGFLLIFDPARYRFAAMLPPVTALRKSMLFSQVASDTTHFTGLTLLNTCANAAGPMIEVFAPAVCF